MWKIKPLYTVSKCKSSFHFVLKDNSYQYCAVITAVTHVISLLLIFSSWWSVWLSRPFLFTHSTRFGCQSAIRWSTIEMFHTKEVYTHLVCCCVSMIMCVCVYVHVCTRLQVNMHINTCAYTHMHTRTHAHVRVAHTYVIPKY